MVPEDIVVMVEMDLRELLTMKPQDLVVAAVAAPEQMHGLLP